MAGWGAESRHAGWCWVQKSNYKIGAVTSLKRHINSVAATPSTSASQQVVYGGGLRRHHIPRNKPNALPNQPSKSRQTGA
jgi:hypothetical protein